MLLELATTDDMLAFAWSRVRANAGGPGADGVTIERFGEDLLNRLGKLRAQISADTYKPDPLLRIELPRPGKEPRLLAVPSVRDRVAQTAVAQVLTHLLDPTFEDESYGYRPGRSVQDAVIAVVNAREEGFLSVVDADIDDFFDNIPWDDLIELLDEVLPDNSLQPLIRAWLASPIKTEDGFVRPNRGVPQGSPLSPLLSNLYLHGLDETISDRDDCRLVRYADDFVILAAGHDAAEQALEEAAAWLGANELAINWDKTRLTTFDQGFTFLGVRFEGETVRAENIESEPWLLPPRWRQHQAPAAQARHPWQQPRQRQQATEPRRRERGRQAPPPNPARERARARASSASQAPVAPPEMASLQDSFYDDTAAPMLRTLYVSDPGSYLHLDGGRLILRRQEDEVVSAPVEKIDQIHVASEGAISFAALRKVLARGGTVVVQGYAGEPLGVFVPAMDNRVQLRARQHRRLADETFVLGIARAVVAAKIHNSRLLLRRMYRFRPGQESPVDHSLKRLQVHSLTAPDLNALRGYEGSAARDYFQAWAGLLPVSWREQFRGRSRQPPADPVNALLSYGYAVLYHNVLTMTAARGLDVHLGHLHAVRDGHPALVSDLVEEFRALIVDSVVLNLTRHHDWNRSDFTRNEEGGVFISRTMRRALIDGLEAKFKAHITHPITRETGDYRRMIRTQIAHYVQVLNGDAPVYQPFRPN